MHIAVSLSSRFAANTSGVASAPRSLSTIHPPNFKVPVQVVPTTCIGLEARSLELDLTTAEARTSPWKNSKRRQSERYP